MNERAHLSFLKRAWGEYVLTGRCVEGLSLALQSPFGKGNPLAGGLRFLLAKGAKGWAPPFVLKPISLPLFELCQLACLLPLLGEVEQGERLAQGLWPLLPLPALWCKEEAFDEEEATLSIALLRRAFGQEAELSEEAGFYFQALARHLPRWQIPSQSAYDEAALFRETGPLAAWIGTEERTSFGAFRSQEIEIRAFGPQTFPLNEPRGFGVFRPKTADPSARWVAVAALPEVWMHIDGGFEEGKLAVQCVGLKAEKPLAVSFYVKAPNCCIGEQQLPLRSLQRYQGEAKPALFGKEFCIESSIPAKMEVIPLAGQGCFWGSDYLLSFAISPLEGRGEYRIHHSCVE